MSAFDIDGQGCYVAALSALPGMGPAQLGAILAGNSPREAWEAVLAGTIQRPRSQARGVGLSLDAEVVEGGSATSKPPWRLLASRVDPPVWWRSISQRGISLTWRGRADYPSALCEDPSPPAAIFWRGRIEALEAPCVAIVGTRNPTGGGVRVAREMGRDLTDAGVCVVSGLAKGIDGAAHRGALEALVSGVGAGPVAVVASGVDVAYPKCHADLWERVAAAGAVISETLPGRAAQAWRFPARNRVIAGLVRLLVVVESHRSGGSLITVEAALQRGIDVRVVPGSVYSPASAGSNQLLYEGAGPVRDASDVLDSLGVVRSSRSRTPLQGSLPVLDNAAQRVLDAVAWRPVTANLLIADTGLSPPEVMRSLDVLVGSGVVAEEAGCYVRIR